MIIVVDNSKFQFYLYNDYKTDTVEVRSGYYSPIFEHIITIENKFIGRQTDILRATRMSKNACGPVCNTTNHFQIVLEKLAFLQVRNKEGNAAHKEMIQMCIASLLTGRQVHVVGADQSQNVDFFFVIRIRFGVLQQKRRELLGSFVARLGEFEFLRHGHLLFEIRSLLLVSVRVIRVHTTCTRIIML